MRVPLLMASLTVAFVASIAPAQDADTRSALERDPDDWVDVMSEAGKDLKGTTRVTIPPGGKLSEPSPWSFDPKTGILTCAGDKSGHEWLRLDKEESDGILHVEWRFVPVEGKKGYNSGMYARNSADGKTWHQAQTGDASGGFLFGETTKDGKLKFERPALSPTAAKVKPAGEWNVFEITCKGDTMSLWVNGAESCRWEKLEAKKGHLGFEAEGYLIEFRNVKYKQSRE